MLSRSFDVSASDDTLRNVVSTMQRRLRRIVIATETTEAETETVMSIVQMSSLSKMTIFFGDTTDGIVTPLNNFLQESTLLENLALSWAKLIALPDDHEEDGGGSVSRNAFTSLCDAISASVSLTSIYIHVPPSDYDDARVAAKLLARSKANSKRPSGERNVLNDGLECSFTYTTCTKF